MTTPIQTEPRPTQRSEEVIKAAVASALPTFLRWAIEPEDGKESGNISKDLCEVLRYGNDGYEMATSLERRSWSPDSELVELLDGLLHTRSVATHKAVAEWVTRNNIQPALKVGDKLVWKGDQAEIAKIYTEDARYTLFIAVKGHVREGVGTHGIVVTFEDVEKEQAKS
jgi:hypothetical protein